ncbi:MAG: 50S ribosomal protein L29 [Mycoplasmataceae bacterium]|jgi:ribosomal protein L29|nr:50S ribosomal protein L29 [Mycoplasmataceae bacterium]
MTNTIKEFANKSNEELGVLALRLKLQLLEGRFDVANKTEKKYNPSQTRKMIARILTTLSQRGFKLSSGAHGLALIGKKDNKTISLNKQASAAISAAEKELIKTNSDFSLGETKSEKELTSKKDLLNSKLDAMDKLVTKSQTESKQKAQVIHKTSGGGK